LEERYEVYYRDHYPISHEVGETGMSFWEIDIYRNQLLQQILI